MEKGNRIDFMGRGQVGIGGARQRKGKGWRKNIMGEMIVIGRHFRGM